MRINNNTKFDTDFLITEQRHLITALTKKDLIESITFEENKTVVFGVDCILAEFDPTKDIQVTATVRWFCKSSGEGVARLSTGVSVPLFACNVEGADSCYPHLVSNVSLSEGQQLTGVISADQYLTANCGLTSVKTA